jgi:hypothetical protein
MVIRYALASFLLFAVACGGSDKKSDSPAKNQKEATSGGLDAGPIPKEGVESPPPSTDAGPKPNVELSAEDKKALDRMEQLASEMLKAVEKAGSDCDKMAANLNKFVDAHGAELKKLSKGFESAPEGKKAKLDEEMQTRMKGKSDAVLPQLMACKSHAGVGKVFERLDAL